MAVASVYIHIPYCKTKCAYCAFSSVARPIDALAYIDALFKEYDMHNRRIAIAPETLYIGGGTPSALPEEAFTRLIDGIEQRFPKSLIESTVEANPESITDVFLEAVTRLPSCRLSVGVQSMNDGVLAAIGRNANRNTIETALALVGARGIRNLSLDLILGLPGTTEADHIEDIKALLAYAPMHFSLYMLDLSEKRALQDEWRAALPSDDAVAKRYTRAVRFLKRKGFMRYETSNFAKKGCEAIHNARYWSGHDYLGLGAGATGTYGGARYTNVANPERYIARITEGRFAFNETETLTERAKEIEYLFLALRTREGISLKEYERRFGANFLTRYKTPLAQFKGLIQKTRKRVFCADNGALFADEIAVECMRAREDERMR